MVRMMFAISVRIQGLNVTPTLSKSSPRQQLTTPASTSTSNILRPIVPTKSTSENWLHFLFSATYYNDISANFMGIIRSLGEAVAGDEKLLHFTGNSGYILLVNTKPARIGLWFYQLVACLSMGYLTSFIWLWWQPTNLGTKRLLRMRLLGCGKRLSTASVCNVFWCLIERGRCKWALDVVYWVGTCLFYEDSYGSFRR